jgi:hypothetical protein
MSTSIFVDTWLDRPAEGTPAYTDGLTDDDIRLVTMGLRIDLLLD